MLALLLFLKFDMHYFPFPYLRRIKKFCTVLGPIWIDYEVETHKNCSRVVNGSQRVIKIFLSEKAIGGHKAKVPTHR